MILSQIVIGMGCFFIAAGTIGLLRYKNFFARILMSSQIDTIGFLTIMIGIIIRSGFNFFSAKILLICILSLMLSPLTTHMIARSAHQSGYKFEKDDKNAP